MSEALKPCPFCGKAGKVYKSSANGRDGWTIKTDCKHNIGIWLWLGQYTESSAILEWNNAYCWKELAKSQAELKVAKQNSVGAEKDVVYLRKELAESQKDRDEFKRLNEHHKELFLKVNLELAESREAVGELVEVLAEFEDIQDHEAWCGHGKTGCFMCKVLDRVFGVLAKHKLKSGEEG